MKRQLYSLVDHVFRRQGIVYALLTAQLSLLLEYYLLALSDGKQIVLVGLHVAFLVTTVLYAKRQALEDGFVETLDESDT